MAGVFTDFGIGGSTRLRPGFQQLLTAIGSGAVAMVAAEALDASITQVNRQRAGIEQDRCSLGRDLALVNRKLTG